MRFTPFLAALSLVLAPVAAHAQSDDPAFTPEAVKAHVDFLADDLLEGRNAGTRGYDLAAHYVATRFEALGLKPAGADGSWYQQVKLAKFTRDTRKPATAVLGGKRFANGADVLMGGTHVPGTQVLSGGAVFVGYGLEADYAGLDVSGKFVVALTGLPKGLTPEAQALAGAEDKLGTAGKKGAIGLISLVTPEALSNGNFPWDSVKGYIDHPQMVWVGPDGSAGGETAAVKIQVYFKGKAADALFAGSAMTAQQLYAALTLPNARPKGFPLLAKPVITRTSKVDQVTSPNVVGMLPGSDPKLASEIVVLSAHLDHDGVDPKLPGPDKIYNGAMDNASGVATMLEVARAFSESRKRPKRSLLFVALTAEEDGLLGSDYLAHYPVGGGKFVADVNLDMPILLYDFKDVIAFGAEHSTLGPIVERAGRKMGVTLSADPLPEENLFTRSDHYSFVKKGVPSVFLMTGFANGGEKAFRGFLATNYHKVTDEVKLPFDWQAGAKFAELNYRIAREIADGDEAPRWYEGNEYGDRFAPGQPRAKKAK